jgi:hypothetical protein
MQAASDEGRWRYCPRHDPPLGQTCGHFASTMTLEFF